MPTYLQRDIPFTEMGQSLNTLISVSQIPHLCYKPTCYFQDGCQKLRYTGRRAFNIEAKYILNPTSSIVRPFSAFLPAAPCMVLLAPKCKVRSNGATNKSRRSLETHQGAQRIMIGILPLKNSQKNTSALKLN